MANILDGVDQRTQLVGRNRMELLLFRLAGKQRYGINVFKVQEVIQCPPLTQIPQSNYAICGVVTIRGSTIPVMDLGLAVGMTPVEDPSKSFVIVTEYNRSIQGFLVGAVERIVNMKWDNIQAPPQGSGNDSFLTAVTRVDDELIEIIDVEKVLAQVSDKPVEISDETAADAERIIPKAAHVLVADDSAVARGQIYRTLEQLGIECTVVNDGRQALITLKKWAVDEPETIKKLLMVISDVEMPEMDGYTLTSEIRRDDTLKDLYIMLHTSLSGGFNNALIEQVGADRFIPKFQAEDLGQAVLDRARDVEEKKVAAA